jgi:hypothetical protein
MDKSALSQHVEKLINHSARTIAQNKDLEVDHSANGQLGYLLSLRRKLDNKATKEDDGLHDAINDILRQLGIISATDDYLSAITQ